MGFSTLYEWVNWIADKHSTEIDLSLDRIKAVASRLQVLRLSCPVIIVGGTNGKGSTVAALESIYSHAGYRVGAFTSPILFKYNEYVRIEGKVVMDEALCQAFTHIEEVREGVSLTPFEFWTLAALWLFQSAKLDVWILEVGLGGRWDAVNILDADVAIVTSISIDHVDYLGSTREAIGYEKAGIFRPHQPAICGDMDPPQSLIHYAAELNTPLLCQAKDFTYTQATSTWSFDYQTIHWDNLPLNGLYLPNMAVVLMAITLLQARLPVSLTMIKQGLSSVKIMGRIQIMPGEITQIYDVAHNPGSVSLLVDTLKTLACAGKTHAVFSMLADKDIDVCLALAKPAFDEWYIAPLKAKRGATLAMLQEKFLQAGIKKITPFVSMEQAYQAALQKAKRGDRIVVFGSFYAISESGCIK